MPSTGRFCLLVSLRGDSPLRARKSDTTHASLDSGLPGFQIVRKKDLCIGANQFMVFCLVAYLDQDNYHFQFRAIEEVLGAGKEPNNGDINPTCNHSQLPLSTTYYSPDPNFT